MNTALTHRQIEMLFAASDCLTLADVEPGESYPVFSANITTLMEIGFIIYDPYHLYGWTITEQGTLWLELNDDDIFDAMWGGTPDDWKLFFDDSEVQS